MAGTGDAGNGRPVQIVSPPVRNLVNHRLSSTQGYVRVVLDAQQRPAAAVLGVVVELVEANAGDRIARYPVEGKEHVVNMGAARNDCDEV